MENQEQKISKLNIGLSSAGALAGLYYAFHTKRKFWGYVGFFILGSVAGTLTAKAIESTKKDK
jgi:hypothetical protein